MCIVVQAVQDLLARFCGEERGGMIADVCRCCVDTVYGTHREQQDVQKISGD